MLVIKLTIAIWIAILWFLITVVIILNSTVRTFKFLSLQMSLWMCQMHIISECLYLSSKLSIHIFAIHCLESYFKFWWIFWNDHGIWLLGLTRVTGLNLNFTKNSLVNVIFLPIQPPGKIYFKLLTIYRKGFYSHLSFYSS